jgi:GT2 family glycosyltransferase
MLAGEAWDGAVVLGHVADLDAELNRARLMVAPLRYGAGVKGKIGEALAAGLPVVTTTAGAEGMGIEDGTHAFVRDDPAAFAAAVCRLLEDSEAWGKMARHGRDLAEHTLSVSAVRERALSAFTSPFEPRWRTPPISIIMLSWNGLAYTRMCVESVLRNSRQPFELIVIENGSRDGSLEYLRGIEGIQLIENATNRGFAPAVNQGLAVARGDWVVLLNNDTVVPPGWLERLIAHGERDRTIGLIGPMSNHTAGYQLVRPVPYGEDLGAMEQYAGEFGQRFDGQGLAAPRAIGFCLAIRRELIQRIGGLDEVFGNGSFEDDDYSIRAQLAGFRVWIARDAFIHHFGSRSYIEQKIDLGALMEKNWGVFKRKWGVEATRPYDRGIPYEELLSRRFDGGRDFVPVETPAVVKEQRWVA